MKKSVTLEELLDEAVVTLVEQSVELNDKIIKDKGVKTNTPNALKSILAIELWKEGYNSPTIVIGHKELESYGINSEDYDMEEEVRNAITREYNRNVAILKLINNESKK
jgi:hypothetical protein